MGEGEEESDPLAEEGLSTIGSFLAQNDVERLHGSMPLLSPKSPAVTVLQGIVYL